MRRLEITASRTESATSLFLIVPNRTICTNRFRTSAVLGDGRIALILDLSVLAKRRGMTLLKDRREDTGAENRVPKRSFVLVAAGHGERLAIPIQCVERLEDLAQVNRETLGGLEVMQYGESILTISSLESLLAERRTTHRGERIAVPNADRFAAVVVRLPTRGLVILEVAKILGIANVEVRKLNPPSRRGVEGSMVIQDRVTEIVDIEQLDHLIPGPTLGPEDDVSFAEKVLNHGG
jgi:two-component system chemotaxis sensor kinase CheA